MKTAILYHSESGNTGRFANTLADALMQAGHTVNSVQLQTTAPVKKASVRDKQEITFRNLPDLSSYDLIIFGGPVWAFGPSPVIIAAIKQCTGLEGKTALPIASMGFPFRCLGGTASLRYMNRELVLKGAKVLPGSICRQMMNKLDSDIAQQTAKIVKSLSSL